MGDMIFYYHPFAKKIVGRTYDVVLASERARTDPAYEKLRANGHIHGDASKACSLLRKSFGEAVAGISDGRMFYRMMRPAKQVLIAGREEDVHPFHTGHAQQMRGFQFNRATGLHKIIVSGWKIKLQGEYRVTKFDEPIVEAVKGASHFQIVSFVVGVDFEEKTFEGNYDTSERIEHGSGKVEPFELNAEVPAGYPVYFNVIAIRQFKLVNGTFHALNNSTGQAADIVEIWNR